MDQRGAAGPPPRAPATASGRALGCAALAVLVVAGAVLAIDEPWRAVRRTPGVEARAGGKGATNPATPHRSAPQATHRSAHGRRPAARRHLRRHTGRVVVVATKRSSSTVESSYQPRQSANTGSGGSASYPSSGTGTQQSSVGTTARQTSHANTTPAFGSSGALGPGSSPSG